MVRVGNHLIQKVRVRLTPPQDFDATLLSQLESKSSMFRYWQRKRSDSKYDPELVDAKLFAYRQHLMAVCQDTFNALARWE